MKINGNDLQRGMAEAPAGPARDDPDDPWAHRTVGMRCRSCMFYAPKAGTGGHFGRCRRHAPSMGGYPAVYSHDWCGDHKMDESAAVKAPRLPEEG